MAQEGAVRGVHDPSLIKANGSYHLFSTGPGIPIRRSRDLYHWEKAGASSARIPGGSRRQCRARRRSGPDVCRYRGAYLVFYSISRFGSNRSSIGLATNATLDPADSAYRWVDRGPVISSSRDNDWNAIDPGFFIDRDDQPWLVFGSFWSGIKLVRLDPATLKPPGHRPELISLAARPDSHAVEAPFLIRHGDDHYLFVSFDRCCRGVDSTYRVMVGRSARSDGPLSRSTRAIVARGRRYRDSGNSGTGEGARALRRRARISARLACPSLLRRRLPWRANSADSTSELVCRGLARGRRTDHRTTRSIGTQSALVLFVESARADHRMKVPSLVKTTTGDPRDRNTGAIAACCPEPSRPA